MYFSLFLALQRKPKKIGTLGLELEKSLINIDFFITAKKLVIIRSNIGRALRLECRLNIIVAIS